MLKTDERSDTRPEKADLAPINLLRGQAVYAHLQRGTVINVAVGRISINTRVLLDNTALTLQTPVSAGGVYRVSVSGDYELAALTDTELRQQSPQRLDLMGGLLACLPCWSRTQGPGLLNNAARA